MLRAAAIGADAVELDVRLTRDGVPVVFHRVYLDGATTGRGPVFAATLAELRALRYVEGDVAIEEARIPTLAEVLDAVADGVGLEIELKGPEPEAAEAVARVLGDWRRRWEAMEVTSFEPALLLALGRGCRGVAVDLLTPDAPSWMGADVVVHQALHRGRLAGARAVHLHLSQLSAGAVRQIHAAGMDVHAWGVNDAASLARARALGIRRVCTDDVPAIVAARGLPDLAQNVPGSVPSPVGSGPAAQTGDTAPRS